MDALLAEMDGRVKVSLTDSTMMKIVRQAMDKAQEKLMSKHGVLGRLIEISKFYELAVMQLEGCLKFVQEETVSSNLEVWHEDVLDDLSDIRDRLQGRLEDTEKAIMAKDRELKEKVELELRLRHALEVKERELVCLRAKLEVEKNKPEGVDEMVVGNRLSVDESIDEEFSELMQSVDQQVSNIEHKLEPAEFLSMDDHDQDISRSGTVDSKKIEDMGSDIHILKETFNLAFGKMQNAILLSEMEPTEQQWRLTVEESIFGTLVKGLVNDLQESFGDEVKKNENQVSMALSEHLSILMSEMTSLRSELESVTGDRKEGHFYKSSSNGSYFTIQPSLASPSENRSKSMAKIPPKAPTTKVEEAEEHQDGSEEDGGNFVAKMVKNHESIIRRKSQELNWLPPEKEGRPNKRNRADDLKRRIQEVISRLDNLISWNAKMGETLTSPKRKLLEVDGTGTGTLEDVWEMIHRVSASSRAMNEELQDEVRMLKQDKEDMDTQQIVQQEMNGIVFTEAVKNYDHYVKNYDQDMESLFGQGIHQFVICEALKDASISRKETESRDQDHVTNSSDGLDGEGDSNRELDSLNKILELDDDGMVIGAASETREGDKYLERLSLDREMLNNCEPEEVHDELIPMVGIVSDREVSLCQPMEDQEPEPSPFNMVLLPLVGFSQVLEDFECMVDRRIGSNIARLEEGKRCVDSLVESVGTVRKSESLYKDAFIRRCQNLHKAEVEVDMLGDQVDMLLELLKKIYKILQHYSPLLQPYTEVWDMVNLIKKVLVTRPVDFPDMEMGTTVN